MSPSDGISIGLSAFDGRLYLIPSPTRKRESIDTVVFRESTEDAYAGLEAEAYTDGQRVHWEMPLSPIWDKLWR